jgi:hypothetical protein
MAGRDDLRGNVDVAARAPAFAGVADAPGMLYVGDLVPARQVGAFRRMTVDRTTFGKRLRFGKSRLFGPSNEYQKGIASTVEHGRNAVEYDLAAQYKRFRAVVGLQRPEGTDLSPVEREMTRMIYTIAGDGKTLWESPPVTWNSEPLTVDVTIDGVQTLGLSVRNEAVWFHRADSVNWCDARVER